MTKTDKAIHQLSSLDRTERHEAAMILGETGDKRVIMHLVPLLRDKDAGVRDAAVNSIKNIGGRDAAHALIPFLYDGDDASVRNMAVEILEQLGPDARSVIIPLLKEKDEDVLKFAVDIAGKVGDSRMSALIMPLLSHHNANIRASAVNTLGKLKASESVNKLLDMLQTDDEWVKFAILEALRAIGDQDVAQKLIEMAKKDVISRTASIDILSQFSSPEHFEDVMEFLQDKYVSAIISTGSAIRFIEKFSGRMNSGQKNVFLHILSERLGSKEKSDQREAIRGMGRLKDNRAMDVLLNYVMTIEPDDEETIEIIKNSLLEIGDSESIITRVKTETGNLSILIGVLGLFGDSNISRDLHFLIDKVDRDVKRVLVKSLDNLGGSSYETLIEALRDSDGHVRQIAARSLENLGDPRAVPELFASLLKEPYRNVQEEIASALFSFKEYKNVPSLSLLHHENPTIRALTARNLARWKTDEVRQLLISAVRDAEKMVKKEAAKALSGFSGNDIKDILRECLRDESYEVRLSALEAMRYRDDCNDIIMESAADSELWVRFKAVNMIGEKRVVEALDLVIDRLERDETPVRVACIEVLGRLGSKKSVDALKRVIGHGDPDLSRAAMDALGRIH